MPNSSSKGRNVRSQLALRSGTTERVITIASGTLLFAPVLWKRSGLAWIAAAVGGALIYDGVSGTCAVSRKLGLSAGSPATQRIDHSITIDKDAADLYRLWRNPDTMIRLIRPWADIKIAGENHIRWSIPLPIGQTISGEAIMIEERPNEMVHWSTIADDSLEINEWFHLNPAHQNRGTEVTLEYLVNFSRMRAGRTIRAMSSFFDTAPHIVIGKLLHDFKALAEIGEIPTLERSTSPSSPHTAAR